MTIKFLKKYSFFLILISLGVVLFIRGIIILDPDFGWHLREGELILQSGIQRTDSFSYTMPSYQYIDHEWLTNVLISVFYKFGGTYFLTLVFAIIATLSLFISIPTKYNNYSLIPLILSGILMFGFFAIRPQVITWFFLALLLKLILNENLWKKWKYFVPLIFIPWVNLHGGFAVGIIIIFLFFFSQILVKRKFSLKNFLILFFSVLLTFLNPYGTLIWKEIWMQISDSSLRWSIGEWLPGLFYFDIAMIVLFCLSSFFVFMYRSKLKTEKILIYIFLLFMAILSIRHIPLWAIAAIPITAEVFYIFALEVKKNKNNLVRLDKVKKILVVIIFVIFLYEASINSFFVKNLSYPVKAADYLKTQHIKGNILSIYNWGGYLIWKLPDKKVFVDGRMPSWRRENAPEKESKNAFLESKKIFAGEIHLIKTIKRYDIDYFLLPKLEIRNKYSILIDNILNDFFKIKNSESKAFYEDLKNNSIIVYEDSIATIYEIKQIN